MRLIRRDALTVVLAVGLMAIMAVCANAASVSYVTSTPIGYTGTDWTGSLAFQKFNSALGTLYQVDLSITGSIQTTLTVTNTDGQVASSGTAKTEMVLTVTDPLALLSVMPDIISSPFSYSLPPLGTVTSGLLTKNASDSGSWTSGSILAEFTGSGNISMGASTFTQTLLANTGGNTNSSQVTTASATGTVTYYYNEPPPVPEPGSFAVLGIGLVGLLGAIRRRR